MKYFPGGKSYQFSHISYYGRLRPNKEISVFRVTGLKILGRVGTHFFFREENIFLFILKGILLSKCIKKIFFPENL